MDENLDRIEITHYVNPHMFWFKYETICVNDELDKWESKLQRHCFKLSKPPPTAYKPMVDEVIAVFIFKLNRWIRAKCENIHKSRNKYDVWAIDYGMPFQVEDRLIREFPKELLEGPREIVHFGGLMNLVPAQKSYNIEKMEPELDLCDKWSPLSITTIRNLIHDANEIRFNRCKISKAGQIFGNLVFTMLSKKCIQAETILQDIDQAKSLPTHTFFSVVDRIGTNRIPRWVSSSDDTPVALKNDNVEKYEVRGVGYNDLSIMKKQIAIESNETVIDVNQKCTDWEKRNEIFRLDGDISIDDFSFNDSVSVRHLPKNSKKEVTPGQQAATSDSDDTPVLMMASAQRRRILNKYQNNIPRLPSEHNSSSKESVTASDSTGKPINSILFASLVATETPNRNDHGAMTNMSMPTDTDKLQSSPGTDKTSCSNAVKLLKDRRANAKKKFLSKVGNVPSPDAKSISAKDSDAIYDVVNSTFEKIKLDDTKSNKGENINEHEKQITVLSCSSRPKSHTENSRTILEDNSIRRKSDNQGRNIIPAGFDLRNLVKNKKSRARNSFGAEEKSLQGIMKNTNKTAVQIHESQTTSWTPNIESGHQATEIKSRSMLKRSYKESNTVILNNLDEQCLQTNFSKHLVLVHGKHVAKPIEKLANAHFCDEVHQELEDMRLTQIYRIQSFTWPHIMRGNSSVIINSARTGRTLSYLPAICSLIKMESDDGKAVDTVGPIGIIVAPSSVEVERTSKMAKRFLHGGHTKIAFVESYGIRNADKTTRSLLNGCEVLIATPSSLTRLIKSDLKLFDSKRVRHLVIDNVDLMHEDIKTELHEILRYFCAPKSIDTVQLVVIAKYWNPILFGFLKVGLNSQLCIGAYIEGAVYARSLIRMKFINQKAKTHEVLEFIKSHPYLTERLIIVCNKDEEVEEVIEVLKLNSCFHVACCSQSTADEIELSKVWQQRLVGDLSILVCTDDVLPEIKVNAAQNIIHYSLPHSWTKFSYRFSTLFGSFNDFLKSSIPTNPPPACLILLDENNNSQLPKLIHFLEIHNVEDIPKEVYSVCNKIKIQREEERICENREFCHYMMEFGRCSNFEDCIFRHELTKYDIPNDHLLMSGDIKFKVLAVITPTLYTVRILEHLPTIGKEWRKIDGSNSYLKYSLKFAQYFSNSENHQLHWPIEVGDICVISEGKTYHRAKVLFVTKSKSRNFIKDFTCRVQLVDVGRIITSKSSQVLYLPEEFKNYPYQAINLRISGVIPCDMEQDWSSNAIETVQYWFEKYVTDKADVVAKIKFSLMNTIWAENIKVVEKLESIATYVTVVNIKHSLLDKQFGIASNEAEEILKEKAMSCGIFKNGFSGEMIQDLDQQLTDKEVLSKDLPSTKMSNCSSVFSHGLCEVISEKNFETKSSALVSGNSHTSFKRENTSSTSIENGNTQEYWENLPENKFNRVLVGAFYNPHHCYIQHLNDMEKKETLYNAIDKFVERKPPNVRNPKIGLNCLAKQDDKYNRAKITKVLCDGESNDVIVSLFFCDIGISATMTLSQVLCTSMEIVQMIPFQAIRCKMIGITSTTYGVWTEEDCDRIYDEIIGQAQFMYARRISSEKPSEDCILKYWRCEIVLLDCSTENDVNINELVVQSGLANYDVETEHFLSIMPNLRIEDDTESACSNWDGCNYVNTRYLDVGPSSDDLVSLNADIDIQFTQDDILQLLNLPNTAKILPPCSQDDGSLIKEIVGVVNDDIGKSKTYLKNRFNLKNENLVEITNEIGNRVLAEITPNIKCLHKVPQVIWQQSKSLISLQIYVPDVDEYYLKVTSTFLIFLGRLHTNKKGLTLNFCGCVDASMISHEVRGINVIVRLPKAIKGINWPRLTSDSDKPSWIRYNYDSVIVEQKVHQNIGRQRHDTPLYHSTSDTDSCICDGNDIPKENDVYDPFDDDFLH